MRLKNALEAELWLWSMQREKFSEMQKHIMKGVPGAKRRPRFMLRRLTVLKFNEDKTFDDEIRELANEFDAIDEDDNDDDSEDSSELSDEDADVDAGKPKK